MKLTKLYEEMMKGLHFHHDENDERMDITLMDNEEIIGSVTVIHVMQGYMEFEDVMDEDTYYNLFGDDDFYQIEHLEVKPEYTGGGYGQLLMQKAIDFVKGREGRSIYLNASPMSHKGLDLDNLVAFYKKFGFEIIPELDKWPHNKEMLLRLKQIG
jgi:ribosomal protein S18 acetylase RimI-like enzyme